MSKVHPKLTFPDKGLYSPSLFRLKQVQVSPSNPSSNPYYGPNQVIEFNLGGGSNEFIIPESAFLTFEAKTFAPTDWPSTVGNRDKTYNGATGAGLPRPDYGVNWFQDVDVRLDRTRSVVNLSGTRLVKDWLNGRLSCAPYGSSPDILDLTGLPSQASSEIVDGPAPGAGTDALPADVADRFTKEVSRPDSGAGTFNGESYNGDGPLKLCGFLSNYRRALAYCGSFRTASVNSQAASFRVVNGGINYRLPMSLFCGLFGPSVSSMIPIGMMSQSAESAIQVRLRTSATADALVAARKSISTLRGSTGVGFETADDLSGGYGLYSPTITYRVVEILDNSLLASLQAVFNGLVGEQIMLDGQMQSIPRLLTIGYDNWQVYQYVHSANRRTSFLDMSITEPSVKGLMIRLTTNAASSSATKSFDDEALIVENIQIKVGSQTYPLTPVKEQMTGLVGQFDEDVTEALWKKKNEALKNTASTSVASAQLSAWSLEAKQLFSPFADFSYNNQMDGGYLFGAQAGVQFPNGADTYKAMRPLIFSFENRSQLEDLRSQDPLAASGIDLRGIGNIRVDMSLLRKTSNTAALAAPTVDVNVTVALLYDSVLRIARNVIDPVYQFTMMS